MKIKKLFVYTFAVGAVFLLIKNASQAILYASQALDMCFGMIVPSLFPFFSHLFSKKDQMSRLKNFEPDFACSNNSP